MKKLGIEPVSPWTRADLVNHHQGHACHLNWLPYKDYIVHFHHNYCVIETRVPGWQGWPHAPYREYSILGSWLTGGFILHWPTAYEFHNSVPAQRGYFIASVPNSTKLRLAGTWRRDRTPWNQSTRVNLVRTWMEKRKLYLMISRRTSRTQVQNESKRNPLFSKIPEKINTKRRKYKLTQLWIYVERKNAGD